MEDKILAEIPAGRDVVRLVCSEFKGKPNISLRRYYLKDDDWAPTQKGITIHDKDHLDTIRDAFLENYETMVTHLLDG